MKIRMIALAALAALTAGSALAADATLLSLIPPGAKVVAGVRVTEAKASPFGHFVLSILQPGADQELQKLIAATGFDPRRDVSEILLATATPGTRNQGLVAVRGVFDPARIESAATAHGCTTGSVLGVTMFVGGDAAHRGALALPDATTAILGDVDSVKAAIARYRSRTKPADDVQKRVQAASLDASGAANDFWFVTLVPFSEIAPQAPAASTAAAPAAGTGGAASNAAPAAPGAAPTAAPGAASRNMAAFQSVQQASGGVRFTADNMRLGAQLVMRSDKDAQAVTDVIRFLVTMVQAHRERDPATGNLTSLLDAVTLSTSANVAQVALVLPEAQVEQLLNAARQHKHAASQPPAAN